MIELNETERNILLYAKGYYKRSKNPTRDISYIIDRTGGESSTLVGKNYTIIEYLTRLNSIFTVEWKNSMDAIVMDSFFVRRKSWFKNWISINQLVNEYLNRLANYSIKAVNGENIVSLGEPDYKILPKPEFTR